MEDENLSLQSLNILVPLYWFNTTTEVHSRFNTTIQSLVMPLSKFRDTNVEILETLLSNTVGDVAV